MRRALSAPSRRVIWVALLADGALTLTKFAAASFSGSSAMFAKALHSLADASSQGLFFLGRTLGRQPADERHPFGYGKERFFWPFMVSVVTFWSGVVVSLLRGIQQVQTPRVLSHFLLNLFVLGVAVAFDGISWVVARRELRRVSSDKSIWSAIRDSKPPAVFTVFLQDTAGLTGIALATIGTILAHGSGFWIFDGMASICIGILLFSIALIIASETKAF